MGTPERQNERRRSPRRAIDASPAADAMVDKQEKLFSKMIDRASDAFSTRMEDKLEGILTRFEGIVNQKVATIEKKFDDKFEEFKKRMDEQEKRIVQSEQRTSVSPSLSASTARPVGSGAAHRVNSVPVMETNRSSKHGPAVVVTGFPRDSKKKIVEEFVKEAIEGMPDFKHLKCFAPGVRTSMAIVRVSSNEEGFAFCKAFKDNEIDFQGARLRARGDKTADERKRNRNVYNMTDYFNKHFEGNFEADYRRGIVWADEGRIATWNTDSSVFDWSDDLLQSAGYKVDKAEAAAHMAQ